MDGHMKDGAAWMEPEDQIYMNLQELSATESCSQHQGPQGPEEPQRPQEPGSAAAQETGSSSSVRAAALPLLGFLLLTALIGLAVVYNRDFNQLSRQLANQTAERLQLLDRYRNLTEERDRLETSLSAARRSAGSCPDGWRKFSCSCYFLSETQNSWETSRQLCFQQGAELVTINSWKEMDFLKEFGSLRFWFGLHQSSVGGSWIWPDGSSPATTYWLSGHPYNAHGTRRCAAFNRFRFWQRQSWSSEACYSHLNWVCEKDVF